MTLCRALKLCVLWKDLQITIVFDLSFLCITVYWTYRYTKATRVQVSIKCFIWEMAIHSYWCNCSGGCCHFYWKCVQRHPDRACQKSLSRGSVSTSSRLWLGRECWQRSRPSLTTPAICSIGLLLHRGMRLAFGCSLHSVLSFVLFHCCCQAWLESFLLHLLPAIFAAVVFVCV